MDTTIPISTSTIHFAVLYAGFLQKHPCRFGKLVIGFGLLIGSDVVGARRSLEDNSHHDSPRRDDHVREKGDVFLVRGFTLLTYLSKTAVQIQSKQGRYVCVYIGLARFVRAR